MAKRKFKYVPYEKWLEMVKKADEAYKKGNNLLKENGYELWKLSGVEMNLMNDRSLNFFINDGQLIFKDGKMYNRFDVLSAIRKNREPQVFHKSLGQLYEEWFGLEGGTEKQKLLAGKIRLEALLILDELKKLVPYYTFRFKDVDGKKMEQAIDAIKGKIEGIKDVKKLIKMKAILKGDFAPKEFKVKALTLLDLLNFKGEKGKMFVEQAKKILNAMIRE